ncbi:drug/metabolite transporter (DMT)-like permease [Microbacteriaceae bacterium SG_E_30_P1]|uniref:Drug/metabolite transporter (DMT)-like permease n=1 Tax=Antiquaquibacter oligotrophicus TaxID=2880260 RepID=A0ABT6KMV8_9MICO|nr:DMT family transporter [Antiquaquibacter oligotrophicus]MDH6180467.1 drug/metabolite transporter (DMT)-like permease [Antiquaquibacter oligotrophicus]UDF13795.1 DMT family transporter [Antiquaquibacter oligotrophicus]
MIAVLFGALSAVFFGAGDFVGGFASRRVTAMLVTGLAALAGVIALTIAAPFDGGVWHAETWAGGVGTGITSCLGIWLLYSAYSVGPMTTLAPAVAIVSTLVPMAAGLLTGETFSSLGWASVAIGLIAIALVAAAPDSRASKARPIDMVKASVAGAFLGLFYIYLDGGFGNVYVDEAGLTPIMANRITCVVIAFLVVALLAARGRRILVDERLTQTKPPLRFTVGTSSRGPAVVEPTNALPAATATLTRERPTASAANRSKVKRIVLASAVGLAMLSGTFDATANALFTVGLGFGDLAVLSVVSGFYPAVTIGLAFLILRERPNRLQTVGIVLSLIALVGISLA